MLRVFSIILPLTLTYIVVLYFLYRRYLARVEERQLRMWVLNGFVAVAAVAFTLFLCKTRIMPGFSGPKQPRTLASRLRPYLIAAIVALLGLGAAPFAYQYYNGQPLQLPWKPGDNEVKSQSKKDEMSKEGSGGGVGSKVTVSVGGKGGSADGTEDAKATVTVSKKDGIAVEDGNASVKISQFEGSEATKPTADDAKQMGSGQDEPEPTGKIIVDPISQGSGQDEPEPTGKIVVNPIHKD